MISFEEFCRLATDIPCLFDGVDMTDYSRMAARLSLKDENLYQRTEILTALMDRIQPYLAKTADTKCIPRKDWRRAALYQCVLDFDCKPAAPLEIIEAIHYRGFRIDAALSEVGWNDLIASSKALQMLESAFTNEELFTDKNEDYIRAMAARRLRALGATITYDTGHFEITDGETEIIGKIESAIARHGGIIFMAVLFDVLNKFYDDQMKRYILPTAPASHPGRRQPQLPIAFLLNLCAKYPYVNGSFDTSAKKMAELENDLHFVQTVATDLLSVWGGQRYSVWSTWFFNIDELSYYLQQAVTFDACVHLPQSSFFTEVENCRQLFSWVDIGRFENAHGFTIAEYLEVCDAVGRISVHIRGPFKFNKAILQNIVSPSVSVARLDLILEQLSHMPDTINQGFIAPKDYSKVNIVERPLIRQSKTTTNTYFLLDHSWSAQGVYETLLRLCQKIYGRHTSIEIGRYLELLVSELFRTHGITVKSGKFKYRRKEGECDLLIEAKDVILLIEIKKTPLGRDALGGQDYHILASLGESLIKSLQQAGKVEHILREQGYIDLSDRRGVVSNIRLNGRRIYRFAVTHRDYYSLMDHLFVDRLSSILFNAELSLKGDIVAPPGIADKLQKFNQSLKSLNEQYSKIHPDPEGFNADRPYLDCHFISLPMLRELLKGADGVEAFLKNFSAIQNKTFGSGNFYLEYRTFKKAETDPESGPQFVLHSVDRSLG